MLVLYEPGIDPSRVYYGTDTRALELMVGAALATIWPSRHLHGRVTPGARRTIDAAGVAGLVVIALMFWRSTEFSPFLYRGGFLVLSFATVLAVAAMAHPATRLGPVVGCRPMRWIGQRSYGIYLWHFPIIVLTTPEGAVGADLPRAALQTAATFAVAALSWRYVEDPIRHGALGRLWRRWRAGEWRGRRLSRPAWAGSRSPRRPWRGVRRPRRRQRRPEPGGGAGEHLGRDHAHRQRRGGVGDQGQDGLRLGHPHRRFDLRGPRLRRLPAEDEGPIAAQFGRVGATTQHLEVSGARSIYERFEGQPNAEDVGKAYRADGFDGCWVLALGTNEAANVAAGSSFGYDQRIETMMRVADGDPVLWVSVRSLLADGSPYDNSNMQAWDRALLAACASNPNMRIYDWSSEVKDDWFVEDGIHFTTQGYRQRSKRIADALLNAFPAGAPVDDADNADCRVGSEPGSGPAAAEPATEAASG